MPHVRARTLPSLPQVVGGASAAWLGDDLLVIGGTWWTGTPWDGGTKHWESRIFRLGVGDGDNESATGWRLAGDFPVAFSYGAAVTVGNCAYVLGGQDGKVVSNAIWRICQKDGALHVTRSGLLPGPLTMQAVAIFGERLYLVAGQSEVESTSVTDKVWSTAVADLEAGSPHWKAENPVPGGARTLPMVAACEENLYAAGGLDFEGAPPQRNYRRDAWRLDTQGRWTRIADLPRPLQAGSAACTSHGFLVLSGNDGALTRRERELGHADIWFSRDALLYHAENDAWESVGTLPYGFVTAASASKDGKIIVAGGEIRPGSRTDAVLELSLLPATR